MSKEEKFAFQLLDEAGKYTNRSVVRAFINMADRLVGWGAIEDFPSVPAGYNNLRFYISNKIDGVDEINAKDIEFFPVSEYAENLKKSGENITEKQLLEELVYAGLFSCDDEKDELIINGVPCDALDKSYSMIKDGKLMISPRGCFAYLRWKENNNQQNKFIPF